MTALLQEVFERASSLPDAQQDMLAKEFLRELEWESHWDDTLAKSADVVDRLASEALREYSEGKTEARGIDEL